MTREQLTAILTTTRTDALHLDDGSYIDWSAGGIEVGDADGNVVQLATTRADLTELVHRLAAALLAG